MKVALLHTRLSGYFAACLQEFKQISQAEILAYTWPNQSNAPFNASLFTDIGKIHNRHQYQSKDILNSLLAFEPTVVLTSGWKDKGYARLCKQLKQQGIPIVAGCDSQWKGSLRQHLASVVAPMHVQKFIDVLWVTGERQRYLANALGYQGDRCWDGYYSCDWSALAHKPQPSSSASPDPCFLYVGRYAPEKGLDTLADAYQLYCQNVKNPWRLVCAGAGPLRDRLIDAGAEDRGFVQPRDLPPLMQGASAFVLPSRSEPWGVVAHEATASGLPLILSDACGAGVHLLRHHHNGLSFPAGSAAALAQALQSLHELSPSRRFDYAEASYELSKQYTPQRWAKTLLNGLEQLSASC